MLRLTVRVCSGIEQHDGAGRGSDGSLDASNVLKQYLEASDIRFIGSTTYEEYNRYMSKSKSTPADSSR